MGDIVVIIIQMRKLGLKWLNQLVKNNKVLKDGAGMGTENAGLSFPGFGSFTTTHPLSFVNMR